MLDDVGCFLTLAIRARRGEHERREFVELYTRLGDATCREAARLNKVESKVAAALVESLAPAGRPAYWVSLLEANERRVESLIEGLKKVTVELDARSCPYAVVEGGGVLLGSDLPFSEYCSGDFDVTVSEKTWARAKDAPAAAGFVARERDGRVPWYRTEYGRKVERGTEWIALGCSPFDRSWVPLRYSDRTDVWLERRVESRRVPGLFVLSPSDALALVSGHNSIHSYVHSPGLRLHVDVDRLVRDNSIDWDSYLHEVRAMGIPTRAFVALSVAVGLLGSPVPRRVLRELYPGAKRWGTIQAILASDSAVANGRPKLARRKAITLEMLLEEGGPLQWMMWAANPPQDWLVNHFGRDTGGAQDTRLRLQTSRLLDVLRRWFPSARRQDR